MRDKVLVFLKLIPMTSQQIVFRIICAVYFIFVIYVIKKNSKY